MTSIVEFTDTPTPPKIHALRRLAELAGLTLTDGQNAFLDELTVQQQKARYPQDIATLSEQYARSYAQGILKLTRDFRKWLVRQLKSSK